MEGKWEHYKSLWSEVWKCYITYCIISWAIMLNVFLLHYNNLLYICDLHCQSRAHCTHTHTHTHTHTCSEFCSAMQINAFICMISLSMSFTLGSFRSTHICIELLFGLPPSPYTRDVGSVTLPFFLVHLWSLLFTTFLGVHSVECS